MEKIKTLSILFISLACFGLTFAQNVNKIIIQPDSPIKILSYEAQYQKGNNYSQEGICHKIEYQNTTNRKIIAIQVGLVSFDIWNEFLDSLCGDHIEELGANETNKETWVSPVNGSFLFYSGISYVSKVRFDNGEIWSADLDKISQEIEKIEKEFNIKSLRSRIKY